jgi:hypothetical protein
MTDYLSPTDFASPRNARDRIANATAEELVPALFALAVLLGVDASRVTKSTLLEFLDGIIERQESN